MELIEKIKSKGAVLPLSILRIILGFMLVWAFFDKLLGLGMQTPVGQGMIDGGSPSEMYLLYNEGLFSGLFNWMAQFHQIADVLLMAALILIGGALLLGIATKLSVISGSIFFFVMFMTVFPIVDNPIVDYHIVYIFVLMAIWLTDAGSYLGLGKKWKETALVKRFPILE